MQLNRLWRINEMVWIIITGIIAIIIFLIAVFRGNSDRRGIRHNIDSARKISTGLGTIGDSQNRVKKRLGELRENNNSARRRTEDISKHNKSAKTGIRSAIDILKNAKKRSDNQGS